jgi:outer membrane lipoprotein LolB
VIVGQKVSTLALSLLLCTSCAIAPRTTSSTTTADAAQQILRSGRFSLRYQDINGQTRHLYGHFNWQDNNQTITLKLLHPLGLTLALIRSSAFEAVLERPQTAPQHAKDVETLMRNTLGFSLPLKGLRYWLQAIVAPGSTASRQYDPHTDCLTQIKQDGWTIAYVWAGPRIQKMTLVHREPLLEGQLIMNDTP